MNQSHRSDVSLLAHADPRAICVIKPSSLGDIVQSLPLLPALRARFPAAHIAWIVKQDLADLLAGHPDLDEIITIDVRSNWPAWMRFLSDLRQRRFDLVIDLQGLFRTALMTWATRAPLRVGIETAREGSAWTCNRIIQHTGRSVPAHARAGRVAEAFGIQSPPSAVIVVTSEDQRQWAQQHLAGPHGLTVALHPGARWPTKQWPVDKFAKIALRAVQQYDASLLLVGGKAERELGYQLASLVAAQSPEARIVNLMGESDLKQLAALLARVDLLVTTDSGPMHLAAGLGTPVLGVFTCTSPFLSGPPGGEHEFVATRVDCAASYCRHCPHRGPRHLCCHAEIEVERVWQGLQRLLDKNRLLHHAGTTT